MLVYFEEDNDITLPNNDFLREKKNLQPRLTVHVVFAKNDNKILKYQWPIPGYKANRTRIREPS